MGKQINNRAFIDGQNLYRGIEKTKPSWHIDFTRFRRYLREKYHVEEAYYYIGYWEAKNEHLYDKLQKAGFLLRFREHSEDMKSAKKGNVDTDIVFGIMRGIAEREKFNSVVLVSGDGDYARTVNYLIEKGRLEKLLFPNKKYASSLYTKSLPSKYYAYLSDESVKKKVMLR